MGLYTERVKAIAKVAISLALLAVVVAGVGIDALSAALRDVAPSSWILATVYLWLAYAVGCVRWWRWVRLTEQPLGFGLAASSYGSSIFFNLVLPTGVGGDVVRTWELARAGFDFGALLATAIVDRVVGLAAAVVLALAMLATVPHALASYAPSAWWLLLGSATALAIGYAVYPAFESKILSRLASQAHAASAVLGSMGASFRRCRVRYDALAIALVLSLLAHGLITLSYVELARALGVELALGHFLLIIPLVFIAQTIPIALGGLGLREAALVVLLLDAGVARAEATALSMVFLAVLWLSVLPGGVWAVYKWTRRRKDSD